MRSGHYALALLALASLAACASGPDASYVGELSASGDAQILATDMVEFVSTQIPAGTGSIALDPIPADQSSNALTPTFTTALRHRGFAVADNEQAAAPAAHHVRYWVTPLDGGDLVRVSIDDHTEASRFFVRSGQSGLQAAGPLMVRQDAEADR
ncbi:MAG: hypothetical protein J2P48_20555 [Alphaproteobacteria bacterium]|nr:hypothetical protein [Alphaproteobacteria bacterium]